MTYSDADRTWRMEFSQVLKGLDETWDDVESIVGEQLLDNLTYDARIMRGEYGTSVDPITIWSKKWVYFILNTPYGCFVDTVPRNPDGTAYTFDFS